VTCRAAAASRRRQADRSEERLAAHRSLSLGRAAEHAPPVPPGSETCPATRPPLRSSIAGGRGGEETSCLIGLRRGYISTPRGSQGRCNRSRRTMHDRAIGLCFSASTCAGWPDSGRSRGRVPRCFSELPLTRVRSCTRPFWRWRLSRPPWRSESDMKLLLKGCARCGGDLFPDSTEPEAASFACLQCGSQPYRRLRSAGAERDVMRARRPEARNEHADRTSRAAV
jgi:hypothetical protein